MQLISLQEVIVWTVMSPIDAADGSSAGAGQNL
jgi:hypothetical protein